MDDFITIDSVAGRLARPMPSWLSGIKVPAWMAHLAIWFHEAVGERAWNQQMRRLENLSQKWGKLREEDWKMLVWKACLVILREQRRSLITERWPDLDVALCERGIKLVEWVESGRQMNPKSWDPDQWDRERRSDGAPGRVIYYAILWASGASGGREVSLAIRHISEGLHGGQEAVENVARGVFDDIEEMLSGQGLLPLSERELERIGDNRLLQVAAGLRILSRYTDKFGIDADHDVIYAGDENPKLSPDDILDMEKLGWKLGTDVVRYMFYT